MTVYIVTVTEQSDDLGGAYSALCFIPIEGPGRLGGGPAVYGTQGEADNFVARMKGLYPDAEYIIFTQEIGSDEEVPTA